MGTERGNILGEKVANFLNLREVVKQRLPLSLPVASRSNWKRRIVVTLGILKEKPVDMCIYEVPKEVRKVNEDAYSPRIVSIGPLHADKHDLLAMEEHKWRCMLSLLQRIGEKERLETTLQNCHNAILSKEAIARGSYAKSIKFSKYELVELMLVDGCFIVELLLRSSVDPDFKDDSDLILCNPWMVQAVKHDLVLLENQIPFFILEELFEIVVHHSIPRRERPTQSITDLVLSFFHPGSDFNQGAIRRKCKKGDNHILDLLHNFYLPDSRKLERKGKEGLGFRVSATRLVEIGIAFEKGEENHLWEIEFRDGVLKIPPLCIDETTDSLLRNLIAFEQCSLGSIHYYITSYAILIKSLIHSLADIKLLERKGIIRNNLGGLEDVLTLFNNISREVVLKDFYFGELCEDVKKYEDSWWEPRKHKAFWRVWCNGQIAALNRNYFSNTWRSLSVIAAVVLLLLTTLQTIYSVWSFYHK